MCACIHSHILLLFFDYIHTHIKSHHLFLIVSLDGYLVKKNNSNIFFLLTSSIIACSYAKRKNQIPNDIINKIRISITKEEYEKRKKIKIDRKVIKKKFFSFPIEIKHQYNSISHKKIPKSYVV